MKDMQYKKKIFQLIKQSVGLPPKVVQYYDDQNQSSVDIYIGENRPDVGLSTFSTIGLSEYPIGLSAPNGKAIRIEIISVFKDEGLFWGNVVAECAFNIINDNYSCQPGIVYPDIVNHYCKEVDLKHIYFTTPFDWPDLQKIEFEDKIVLWLLAIPISDAELEFLYENGCDALDELFEANAVQYFELSRKSVV